MSDVYHSYIAGVEQEEFETARISQFEARFQWFLGAGLLLLLLEIAVSTWPVRQAARATASATRIELKADKFVHTRGTETSTAA